MTTRGIHKPETSTVTSRMLGAFKAAATKNEFYKLISSDIS
jgi:GTP cyclohydrolase I